MGLWGPGITSGVDPEYLKKVEEIGEFQFWVPKRQIKKWEGIGELMVNSMY
jgi:hypothetical protein